MKKGGAVGRGVGGSTTKEVKLGEEHFILR